MNFRMASQIRACKSSKSFFVSSAYPLHNHNTGIPRVQFFSQISYFRYFSFCILLLLLDSAAVATAAASTAAAIFVFVVVVVFYVLDM